MSCYFNTKKTNILTSVEIFVVLMLIWYGEHKKIIWNFTDLLCTSHTHSLTRTLSFLSLWLNTWCKWVNVVKDLTVSASSSSLIISSNSMIYQQYVTRWEHHPKQQCLLCCSFMNVSFTALHAICTWTVEVWGYLACIAEQFSPIPSHPRNLNVIEPACREQRGWGR